MDTKENKTIKFIIIAVLIIAAISLVGFAFARYITRLNGNTQVPIAQWNFRVTVGSSQSLDIDLANTRFLDDTAEVDRTKVAPGTAGALQFNINATGSQVSLKYDIDLCLTQIPENLIFYSDAEMTKALYKDNGVIHLDGYFGANDNNKTATKNLYWRWKLETGSTQAEINANDILDSEWIGDRIVLGVQATGRQVMDSPTTQYEVTFDLNGGTLSNHGDSTQITKNVNYGETYGALPTPTREGYTFMGWKNIINLSDRSYWRQGALDIWGNKPASTARIRLSSDLPISPNTKYKLSVDNEESITIRIVDFFSEEKIFISYTEATPDANVGFTVKEFITPLNSAYMNLALMYVGGTTITADKAEDANPELVENIESTTKIVQNQNHTLTAIWEPNQ